MGHLKAGHRILYGVVLRPLLQSSWSFVSASLLLGTAWGLSKSALSGICYRGGAIATGHHLMHRAGREAYVLREKEEVGQGPSFDSGTGLETLSIDGGRTGRASGSFVGAYLIGAEFRCRISCGCVKKIGPSQNKGPCFKPRPNKEETDSGPNQVYSNMKPVYAALCPQRGLFNSQV